MSVPRFVFIRELQAPPPRHFVVHCDPPNRRHPPFSYPSVDLHKRCRRLQVHRIQRALGNQRHPISNQCLVRTFKQQLHVRHQVDPIVWRQRDADGCLSRCIWRCHCRHGWKAGFPLRTGQVAGTRTRPSRYSRPSKAARLRTGQMAGTRTRPSPQSQRGLRKEQPTRTLGKLCRVMLKTNRSLSPFQQEGGEIEVGW